MSRPTALKIKKGMIHWKILDLLYRETWLDRSEIRAAIFGSKKCDSGQNRQLNSALTLLTYRKLICHFGEDILDSSNNPAGPFGWRLSHRGQRFFGMKWGCDD
ncbi:MAG: hypothetical protein PHS31_04320 [Victivallaceae bacterium]|nr:hypothetical protein [Victivallaceae bacterium]